MDSVQAMEAQILSEFSEDSNIGPIHDILEIDAETRTINIPSTELLFGVESDRDVERKYFLCPKIVGDNIDLSKLSLRVHFENPSGDKDKYIVDDVQIDGNYIIFSWLLSAKVLKINGSVNFIICAVKTKEDGSEEVAWNTTLSTGTVLHGLEVDDLTESEEDEARDVLQQLLGIFDIQKDEAIRSVRKEGNSQIEAVEAKGQAVIASIPEEYTTLSNQVNHNTKYLAPVIQQTVGGTDILVHDSAKHPILGMNIYGKSVQDGEPTFETPVDIVSIGEDENINVSIHGKNIFNESGSYTAGGVYATLDGASVTLTGKSVNGYSVIKRYDGYGYFKKGVTYTISSVSKNFNIGFWFRDSDYKILGTLATESPGTYTLTIPEGVVMVDLFYAGVTKESEVNLTEQFMINVGENALAFEESHILQTLSIPHTMRGVPVTSGGNYIDENGQQWVCDEIDLERGVYIQNTIMIDFSNWTNWYTWGVSANTEGVTGFHHYVEHMFNNYEVLCTIAKCSNLVWGGKNVGAAAATSDSKYIMISINNDLLADVSSNEKAIESFINFISNRDCKMLCCINPIETTLTDEELLAYKSIHTNYPNTTILNDSGAYMKVAYATDTKLYIDNKIAELINS